mmetsp:Transcript_15802/g.38219  ORF Transcript_15802/g.38219 Transcript_15802/m.38219 type:complete len:537 (+) Transcript_15802:1036-2646(+)
MRSLHELEVDVHVVRKLAAALCFFLLIRALTAAEPLGQQLTGSVLCTHLHQAGVGLVQTSPSESAKAKLDHDTVVEYLGEDVQLDCLVVHIADRHEVARFKIAAVQRMMIYLAEDCPRPLLNVPFLIHDVGQLHHPFLGWPPFPVPLFILRRTVLPSLHHLLLHAVMLVVHRFQNARCDSPLSIFEDLVVLLEKLVASQQHAEHIHASPQALVVLLRMQVRELQSLEQLVVQFLHVQAHDNVSPLLGARGTSRFTGLILVVVFKDSAVSLENGIGVVANQTDRFHHQGKGRLPFVHFHLIKGSSRGVEFSANQLREDSQYFIRAKIALGIRFSDLQHPLEGIDDLVRIETATTTHLGKLANLPLDFLPLHVVVNRAIAAILLGIILVSLQLSKRNLSVNHELLGLKDCIDALLTLGINSNDGHFTSLEIGFLDGVQLRFYRRFHELLSAFFDFLLDCGLFQFFVLAERNGILEKREFAQDGSLREALQPLQHVLLRLDLLLPGPLASLLVVNDEPLHQALSAQRSQVHVLIRIRFV